MIELIQHKFNSTELTGPFNKLDELSVSVNVELINKDIARLKDEEKNTNNSINKKNISALIKYLEKILKYVNEESKFEFCWNVDKDTIPSTYPMTLINEPLYKINFANYVELENNEHLLEIDLTDLADIIAFEFMYKDLGETHESIEELLKDCGIIGFEKASLLTDMFKVNGDKVYELSKSMWIGESPYFSLETRKVTDYFHSTTFKSKDYREAVDYSCKYANTLIAGSIIKNYIHQNIEVIPLIVSSTHIVILIKGSDEINIDEEISIRAFGRRFLIEPKINVL